jgi:hypothetical protein
MLKLCGAGLNVGLATWLSTIIDFVYVPLATELLNMPLLKAFAFKVVVLVKNTPKV